MAGPKPAMHAPRFLFTQIPQSTTVLTHLVPRLSISTRHNSRNQKQWIVAPSFQISSGVRNIHTTGSNQSYISTTNSSRSNLPPSKRRKRTFTTPALSPTAAAIPIRHNGPYALIFPSARRCFSSTRQNNKSHHFDTLKFVARLKAEGFNEDQAAAMMRVLNSVIEESIQNLTRTMVLKEDAERSTYTQKVDFAKLRSELANADSSEIQLTRSSHERLSSDLAKLSARLRDEIGRTQASVRLDLNLEKGRIREEANSQDMRIKETEARIEQEVASLRERVEAVKFSTLQWLMGVCTGTAALILGAWRLLM